MLAFFLCYAGLVKNAKLIILLTFDFQKRASSPAPSISRGNREKSLSPVASSPELGSMASLRSKGIAIKIDLELSDLNSMQCKELKMYHKFVIAISHGAICEMAQKLTYITIYLNELSI